MKKWLSIVIAGDVTSRVVLTLSGLVLIRYMEINEFAKYAVAVAFASLCSGALSSAFGSVLVVSFKRMQLDRRLSDFLSVQIAIGLGLALLILPFETYFSGLQMAAGLLLIANTLSEFARDLDRQKLKFTNYAASNILRSLIFFGSIVLLVVLRPEQLSALNVVILQSLAALLVFLPSLKHV